VAQYENASISVIRSNPRDLETWEAARAKSASMVFIAQASDVESPNVAVSVANVLERYPSARPPAVIVALESDLLVKQVDGALEKVGAMANLRFQHLSIDEESTRPLFLLPALSTLKSDLTVPSHILIIGLGPGARAVLRAALTLGQGVPNSGPHVTVLASEAEFNAEPMLAADFMPPFVATTRKYPLKLAFDCVDEDALGAALEGLPSPTLTAICLGDELAIGTEIAVAGLASIQGWTNGSIAVHQSQEDRLLSMLAHLESLPGHERLRSFGGILPGGTVPRLMKEELELLPHAIHSHYVRSLGEGQRAVTSDWTKLGETCRRASRPASEHMTIKFASLGYVIRPGNPGGFQHSEDEIDGLARMEHRRWVAERLLRGWRLGRRDDDAITLTLCLSIPFRQSPRRRTAAPCARHQAYYTNGINY
jgi:hypothetical protein